MGRAEPQSPPVKVPGHSWWELELCGQVQSRTRQTTKGFPLGVQAACTFSLTNK